MFRKFELSGLSAEASRLKWRTLLGRRQSGTAWTAARSAQLVGFALQRLTFRDRPPALRGELVSSAAEADALQEHPFADATEKTAKGNGKKAKKGKAKATEKETETAEQKKAKEILWALGPVRRDGAFLAQARQQNGFWTALSPVCALAVRGRRHGGRPVAQGRGPAHRLGEQAAVAMRDPGPLDEGSQRHASGAWQFPPAESTQEIRALAI